MRQATLLALTAFVLAVTPATGQRVDYITDEEADLIRDAQGLQLRLPALLKLADNRIVALGLRELTQKERDQIKKDIERYEAEARDAAKIKDQDVELRARPVNPAVYLRNFTRAELLRGYIQVIDEAMDNIDDAYDRRLEVRPAVEELAQFVRTQLPRLRKFEAKNNGESSAIASAVAHSEETLDEIQSALDLLPKTERKISRP
jgi:hypothetical protein